MGWTVGSADGALTLFYAGSTLFVVIFASISDRLGSRKAILFTGIVTSFIAIGFIPFASGGTVLLLMAIAGLFMDGFMAIFVTLLLETEGVGHKYSGTAIGVVFTIAQLGSVFSPPIGNGLTQFGPQWPFIFWAALGATALVPFMFVKETGRSLKLERDRIKAL
jgi:MFS family permease